MVLIAVFMPQNRLNYEPEATRFLRSFFWGVGIACYFGTAGLKSLQDYENKFIMLYRN